MAQSRWMFSCIVLAIAATTAPTIHAFYVDGVSPRTFSEGENIPLMVNAMTSFRTLIPKDYYSLPFCQPEGGIQMASQSLGEFLTGNRIQRSPYYNVDMLQELRCRKVCQVMLSRREAARLQQYISEDYHHNWILDNLPSASARAGGDEGTRQQHYAGGFPIGFMNQTGKQACLNNHVRISIDYVPHGEGYRVVGFAVVPVSVQHKFVGGYQWDGVTLEGFQKNLETCPTNTQNLISQESVDRVQHVEAGQRVLFTYDVSWRRSEVEWSSRWHIYLTEDHLVPAQVHWYSIVNSLVVIVFLSMTVTCILVKNLRKDVAAARGRSAPSEEDSNQMEDEKGWKALHGDVFRPPKTQPMLFCAFVGIGSQLLVTGFVVLYWAMCGMVSPARRGSLLNAVLTVYALCSFIAGYTSSRLYKAMGGPDWKRCNRMTATLFSGIAFGLLVVLNIFFSLAGSTAYVPVLEIFVLICIWGFISVPLCTYGSNLGFVRTKPVEFPTQTFPAAREIPPPSMLWKTPVLSMIMTGCFTFAAVYVELFFIMVSLWMNQYYYVFGFAMLVYIVTVITCSEVTILAVYYRLNAENHQWWWQAFFWSGSIGFYTCLYSILFYPSLDASFSMVTFSVYNGYMLLLSFALFLGFGSVGFLAAMLFVRRMYSVVNQMQEGYVELLDSSGESSAADDYELDLAEQET